MAASPDKLAPLPDTRTLREAVRIYLAGAYPRGVPAAAERFMPPLGARPGEWLMGDPVERTPPEAPLGEVRSFALRMGNEQYPHMKLRLTRVPAHDLYVFGVDSHDAFLRAIPGSDDEGALESLKRHNAAIAAAVAAAMDAAGLPTERSFLREKVRRKQRDKG